MRALLHTHTLQQRASDTLRMLSLSVGILIVILIAGLMSAYAPEFAVRVAPLAILLVVLLLALLNRNRTAVSLNFRLGWITVLLAVFTLWPSYLLVKVGGLPALDLRRIAAGLSLILGLYYVLAGRGALTSPVRANSGPIQVGYWLVNTYVFWRLLSCSMSAAPILSLVQVFWEFLYYYSFFYIGHVFFSADPLRDRVHKAMLWLILVVAAYACVERVLGNNPLVQWAPSNEEFEASVRAMTLSRIRDGVFRTQSTFEHPLLLAEFAALTASFAMAAMLWPQKGVFMRLLGTAAFIGSGLAAYFSGSRSAFVALGAGVAVVLILRLISPKSKVTPTQAATRKLLAVGLVAAVFAMAAPVVILLSQGKNTGEAGSTASRVLQLQTGLDALAKQPILGWGPGSGPVIAGVKTGDGLRTMDNYLLSVAIESGVPGILLFMACILYPAWAAFSCISTGANSRASFLAATAGVATALIAMRAILWMPFNLSFVFLFAGIALSQCTIETESQSA